MHKDNCVTFTKGFTFRLQIKAKEVTMYGSFASSVGEELLSNDDAHDKDTKTTSASRCRSLGNNENDFKLFMQPSAGKQ